jgi:hypothetical protein
MRFGGSIAWTIGICGLLLITSSAEAEAPNACAGLFDPTKGDWDSPEAHVTVAISEEKSACFLVPRNVTDKSLREYYGAGKSLSLAFDPGDLFNYLHGKTSITVGSDARGVVGDSLSCLASPTPNAIAIFSGNPRPPATIEMAKSSMTEAKTDLPGYHRYVDSYGGDSYFADDRLGATASFWCAAESGLNVCGIIGDYAGMRAGIRYLKQDMPRVKPESALACVRSIGDLFRIR